MSRHIALCGPATLEMLQPFLPDPVKSSGYPFPLIPALAVEYMRLGHTVSIVTTAGDTDGILTYSGPNLNLYIIPSRARARDRALDFFRQERQGIQRVLRDINPDVIHAHWTYEFALAALESRVAPVLVTAHDAPLTILRHMRDPYRAVRTLMAYRVRFSSKKLSAVSPYLVSRWRSEMLYRRTMRVIPNPVPQLELPRVSRADYPVVLDIADSSPRKNVRGLLLACSEVRKTWPDLELRLIGSGLEEGGPMNDWARAKGLDSGVRFLGRLSRSEVSRHLAEATLFCHSSLEESQGICLLEAMAAGIPIVAGAESGAVPWTLFDGLAGRLIDVRSPAAISQGIRNVLADAGAAAITVKVAAEMMQSRYSPESVAQQYIEEYEALINDQPGNPSRRMRRKQSRIQTLGA